MANKPEHIDRLSADGAQVNLDALYQIAPSVFTEAADPKTGEVRRMVDFDALRQLLGDNNIADEDGEQYAFTWVGKRAAKAEAARPTSKTLRPVVEDSKDWDTTKNIYIEGDNLEVLKLLQRSYLGRVKMIYIDPPYNTGSDFVYHDDFHRSAAEEDREAGNVDKLGNRFRKNTDTNGKFHSDWCSMIYSRLLVARSLLSEDGVIFISIDDNEQKNLKNVCDEIFGCSNFLAQVVWERAYAPINLKKHFSNSHDYILCYSKNTSNTICNGLSRGNNQNKDYKNLDNDPRGPWKAGNPSVGPAVEKNIYEIVSPTGRSMFPPSGRSWLYSKERFQEMLKDNRIYWGKDGNSIWAPKMFLSEVKQGVTPMTIWKYSEVGHSQDATKKLKELFNGKDYFDYPKPVTLIERCLQLYSDKDSIVLDFFSGSATTAHAVMQLNAEDGGNRKFIMVQLPEETPEDSEARKAGYKNICEIGKERIRRASKKIKDELGKRKEELGMFANDNSSSLTPNSKLDTGFRVFRLDESNYENVSLSPSDYKQDQLDLFADNIKADRTDLDLLFGAMLSWGVTLDLPMQTSVVDGCKIYTVNEGDLVACFSEKITDGVVKAMTEQSPLRVLFRDACFDTDDKKINIYEQFKQAMDWTDTEAFNNIKVI